MSDEKMVSFVVRDQYIIDLSFESQGPDVFRQSDQDPEVSMNIQVNGGAREGREADEPGYHIDMHLHITAAVGDKTGYILEVKYRCDFDITGENLSEESVKHIVLAEVPRYMFPFVRQEVARITAEGGFSPLRLMPIAFAPSEESEESSEPAEENSNNVSIH